MSSVQDIQDLIHKFEETGFICDRSCPGQDSLSVEVATEVTSNIILDLQQQNVIPL